MSDAPHSLTTVANPVKRAAPTGRCRRDHPEFKVMQTAHRKVGRAVASGKLIKPDGCSKCGQHPRSKIGKSLLQGHHHMGYDQPLEVVWLCIACHAHESADLRGQFNGRAKLTEAEVCRIRFLGKQGVYQRDIADQFGVCQKVIWQILHRKRWRHI